MFIFSAGLPYSGVRVLVHIFKWIKFDIVGSRYTIVR